jgi:hypothetical protein
MTQGKVPSEQNDQLLIIRIRPAGFFSNYFFVLEGIQEAIDRGLTPVVGFAPQGRMLATAKFGPNEQWSDYFDVLEDTRPALQQNAYKNLHSHPSNRLHNLGVDQLSSLAKTHLGIKAHIKQEFDELAADLIGRRQENFLGVHFRGRDMHWHPNHPTPLLKRQLVSIVKTALAKDKFTQIFVATDTPSFVRRLRKSVNVPVVSVPIRPTDRLSFSKLPVKRVLFDAYLLSRCSGLVHSQSNVSFAARVLRGVDFNVRYEATLGRNPSTLSRAIWKFIVRMCTPAVLSKEVPTLKTKRHGD